MKKTKDFIRHELLNIFTVINIFIANNHLAKKKKKRMTELMKLATLLVSHENILLGEKPQFFVQELNVTELIETLGSIYEEDIMNEKVTLLLPKKKCSMKVDKHYFKEAIEQILIKLISFASEIDFSINNKPKQIVITYKSNEAVALEKGELLECLNKRSLKSNEIGFQLGLEILDMLSIKYALLKNQIIINLV